MESWNQDLYSRNHRTPKKVWRKHIRCRLPPLETLYRQCWRWCFGQSLCLKSRQKLQRNAKNDEKKSNQRTLNKKTIQNRIIKFELEEKKIKSENNALYCDILWQFFVSNSTLCDTYYVALYLKARSAAGSRWLLTPKNKREKNKKNSWKWCESSHYYCHNNYYLQTTYLLYMLELKEDIILV